LRKIKPFINFYASLLYLPITTKLKLDFNGDQDIDMANFVSKSSSATSYINKCFQTTNTDIVISQAVIESLVGGSAFIKFTLRENDISGYSLKANLILPEQIGVWREDSNSLDDQEVVTFITKLTFPELRRWLYSNHPKERAKKILEDIVARGFEDGQTMGEQQGLLVVTGAPGAPQVTTHPEAIADMVTYNPEVAASLYDYKEIWVWDDELEDYRDIVTIGDSTIAFDSGDPEMGGIPGRPNPFIEGEHPFCQIVVDVKSGWFWGESFVEDISPIQDWINDRLLQIDLLFQLALDPPVAFVGPNLALSEEKVNQFFSPGGRIKLGTPNSTVQVFFPQIPESSMTLMEYIEKQMHEQANLGPILLGKDTQGTKGSDHAAVAAVMGSSDVLRKSILLEKQIETIVNKMYHALRTYDTTKLVDENGLAFILAQLPKGVNVRVDSHSSSPVMRGRREALIKELFQAGIIDGKTVLEEFESDLSLGELAMQRYEKMEKMRQIAQAAHEVEQQAKKHK